MHCAPWYKISGFGFRVSSFGLRVSGFVFWVSGFGFGISGFGFRVLGFGFRFSGFGFRFSGFRFRASEFEFRVSAFRFRVRGLEVYPRLARQVVCGARALPTVQMTNRSYSLVRIGRDRYKPVWSSQPRVEYTREWPGRQSNPHIASRHGNWKWPRAM